MHARYVFTVAGIISGLLPDQKFMRVNRRCHAVRRSFGSLSSHLSINTPFPRIILFDQIIRRRHIVLNVYGVQIEREHLRF
ncbi:hypothetical protein D3C86_1749990 [compost metagenome]